MKNENKRIIYNTEAAAKKPDVNPYCKVEYSLPAPCKGEVKAKCKPLCDKLGISIKELNRLCGVENGYRVALNQLLLIPGDLDGVFGNKLQKYIDAKNNKERKELMKEIRKYLDSKTVKGNKSVNLWNLALWNLANAKDGKVGGKVFGKGGKGKGKKDGGKGPENSKKDKNDPKNQHDKNDPKNQHDKNDPKNQHDKNDPKNQHDKNDPKNQHDKNDPKSHAKNSDNSNSGVKIHEDQIIAIVEKIDKNNELLEPALLKVVADLKALNDAGCTTTPKPNTSLAPQDIWFSNSSAKKQKAQIKKQRQIKKKKQRQIKNKKNK